MTRPNRRELLITRMQELSADGMDCQNCPGTCCTFEANSMLLTPLEAVELTIYLKANFNNLPDLKTKFANTIKTYRLEPKYKGSKSYLRKTYTCPLFNNHSLGCPLPPEVKPYGCLAFNSHSLTSKASNECYSEKELLEKKELLHLDEEQTKNNELCVEFGICWEKAPIPNAVLELWDKV